MIILLMALSMVAAIALLATLAHFAGGIAYTLEAIGSREPSSSARGGEPNSLLSRIWFGVRAIDVQVSALTPQATRLNENLTALAEGMMALNTALGGALGAVEKQSGQSPSVAASSAKKSIGGKVAKKKTAADKKGEA